MKSSISRLGMRGYYTKRQAAGNADSDCVRSWGAGRISSKQARCSAGDASETPKASFIPAQGSLLAGVVVPPVCLSPHKPGAAEEDRNDSVQCECRPQQRPDPVAADAEVSEECRSQGVVGQHAAERRQTRPTGNGQGDQGDAGHASYRDGSSGKFRAEQKAAHEGWHNQQHQARGRFGDGGESQQFLHRAEVTSCSGTSRAGASRWPRSSFPARERRCASRAS
jgi:hypothetical protein